MECHIGVISGDGIGPEIVAEAKKVLDKAGEKYGHSFTYQDILMGGCSIDATGVPLTDEAIAAAKASDAVLMGSIGGNTQTSPWYKLAPELRPEAGLLKLRKSLNLFANLESGSCQCSAVRISTEYGGENRIHRRAFFPLKISCGPGPCSGSQVSRLKPEPDAASELRRHRRRGHRGGVSPCLTPQGISRAKCRGVADHDAEKHGTGQSWHRC